MRKPQKSATVTDGDTSSGSPRIKTQIRQHTEHLSPSVTPRIVKLKRAYGPRFPLSPVSRDDQLIVERLLFALRHARRGVVELGLKTAQVL